MEVRKEAVAPQFYGVKEIAVILGVSKATITNSIKAGRIPAIRVSKYPLIPRDWVDQQYQAAIASVGVVYGGTA
jgi:excisionase family DNA binding protein